MSWRRLQQRLELARIAVPDEEAVGVVAIGQRDAASRMPCSLRHRQRALRCLLSTAVGVGIKGHIDGARAVAQLAELVRIEMGSQRTGDVVKTGLPQHGVVEQALDENHFRTLPDLLPAIQAAFAIPARNDEAARARQAAAIEVAFQRKHDRCM